MLVGGDPHRGRCVNQGDPPLAGLTAVVTGSGRNIGRAIALKLARDGANVVVNGRRDGDALERVVEEIRGGGGEACRCLADVSDPAGIAALVETSVREFGKVDIAVSNVAVRRHQPFLEITPEDWRNTLATNLDAAFHLARAVLPGMRERGFGRLVHISGVDGFTGHTPNRAHNLVCKAGLHALSKGITVEFARFGITANTIAPGVVDTERDWTQYPDRSNRDWAAAVPTRRRVRTGEIAAACAFLAGGDAASISGQVIHVNGGEFMF